MPQVALVFHTYDIVASPADDAETVVAILAPVDTIWPAAPINLHGSVFATLDAATTAVVLRVRRNSIDGDAVGPDIVIAQSATADSLIANGTFDVQDLPGEVAGATYVLTVECVDSAGAASVGAVHLSAQV